METAVANFNIPEEQVFTDYRECLERTQPDIVILCPSTASHAEWVLKVAPYDVHVLLEKPFAANLDAADQMIAEMAKTKGSSSSTGRCAGIPVMLRPSVCWKRVISAS